MMAKGLRLNDGNRIIVYPASGHTGFGARPKRLNENAVTSVDRVIRVRL